SSPAAGRSARSRCSKRSPSATSSVGRSHGCRRTSWPGPQSPGGRCTCARRGAEPSLWSRVRELASAKVSQALSVHEKQARAQALEAIFEEVFAAVGGADETLKPKVRDYFEKVEKTEVRRLIVEKGIRVDGRSVKEVRPIWGEVEYLPRAHGSVLFTRGETQALVIATLGTKDDEQKIESFEGNMYRRFMLHYNFPSFSTGEVKRFGTPGRREICHGALAP